MTLATAEDHGDATPLTLQVNLPANTDPALIPALQQAVEAAMALVARLPGRPDCGCCARPINWRNS